MAEKIGYYSDGVTKFTDPFYRCVCRSCLNMFWSVTIDSACPECKGYDVYRNFDSTKAQEELLRLKKA